MGHLRIKCFLSSGSRLHSLQIGETSCWLYWCLFACKVQFPVRIFTFTDVLATYLGFNFVVFHMVCVFIVGFSWMVRYFRDVFPYFSTSHSFFQYSTIAMSCRRYSCCKTTSVTWTANSFGFQWGSCCSLIIFVCSVLKIIVFLLATILYILRFTSSDLSFGIIKLFLWRPLTCCYWQR